MQLADAVMPATNAQASAWVSSTPSTTTEFVTLMTPSWSGLFASGRTTFTPLPMLSRIYLILVMAAVCNVASVTGKHRVLNLMPSILSTNAVTSPFALVTFVPPASFTPDAAFRSPVPVNFTSLSSAAAAISSSTVLTPSYTAVASASKYTVTSEPPTGFVTTET